MQKLFSEFKPSTANDWKNQVIKDLKGEVFESLVWHNENGFDIQPFYTSEDLKQSYDPAFTHSHWEICTKVDSGTDKELNGRLLQNLNSGASSVSLPCANRDLNVVLNGIGLNYIQSTFFVNENNAALLKVYFEKNYNLNEISCSLFPEKLVTQKDLESWSRIVDLFKNYRNIKTVSFDALSFHNQNCTAYYELAIIMSGLVEYLEFFRTKNEIPKQAVVVRMGVSSDYFIQMAKLRAIRRLWNLLKEEYKINNDIYVIAETSLTNKSISDGYNNLLRTTIEAMAAVSGGCNELVVNGFDVLFSSNKNLSERMAFNQQLILKEESYFDKVADVACGSFYIESITDALASKALETFKYFEKQGGYFACTEKNIFSKEIKVQAEKKAELVNNQKQISIGINKFKNEKEKIDLPASVITELKQMPINNPVLNFELEHFFNLKNA
jgi:methylmalonyl-CoA mutase